jgi:hypothetical protein
MKSVHERLGCRVLAKEKNLQMNPQSHKLDALPLRQGRPGLHFVITPYTSECRRAAARPTGIPMLRATVLLSLLLACLSAASGAQDTARVNSQAAVVPNLVGQPYEQALRLLKAAELPLGKHESVPSHEPHGIVLSQSPEAGARVLSGRAST